MTKLVNYIGDLIDKYYQDSAPAVVCNYDNDYYGDQICTLDIKRVSNR